MSFQIAFSGRVIRRHAITSTEICIYRADGNILRQVKRVIISRWHRITLFIKYERRQKRSARFWRFRPGILAWMETTEAEDEDARLYICSSEKEEVTRRRLCARYNKPLSGIKCTYAILAFSRQVSDITMINPRVLKSSSAPHNGIMRYKERILRRRNSRALAYSTQNLRRAGTYLSHEHKESVRTRKGRERRANRRYLRIIRAPVS